MLANFEPVIDNNTLYFIRKGYQGTLIPALQNHAISRKERGRGDYDVIQISAEDSVIIRHYKRGGLAGRFLPDIFCGESRAMQELAITEQARIAGVPVPEILGIAVKAVFGPFCRLKIISRTIPATTLEQAILGLEHIKQPDTLWAEKTRIIKLLSAAVAKLHQAGIIHRDLHIRNILIDNDQAYIIDLAGAQMSHNRHKQIHDLFRLNRSIAKYIAQPLRCSRATYWVALWAERPASPQGIGTNLTATDRLRLLKAYLQIYPAGHPDTGSNRKDIIIRCSRHLGLHRWWWAMAGQK